MSLPHLDPCMRHIWQQTLTGTSAAAAHNPTRALPRRLPQERDFRGPGLVGRPSASKSTAMARNIAVRAAIASTIAGSALSAAAEGRPERPRSEVIQGEPICIAWVVLGPCPRYGPSGQRLPGRHSAAGEYENRLRRHANPEKVFEYFSSVQDPVSLP